MVGCWCNYCTDKSTLGVFTEYAPASVHQRAVHPGDLQEVGQRPVGPRTPREVRSGRERQL